MRYRCLQTWVPLRKEASSASEMVSSLIFGETCELKDQQNDWLFVTCDFDKYQGWIPENYLVELKESEEPWKRVLSSQSAFFSDGISRIHLSAGSNLPDGDLLMLQGHEFYLSVRDPRVPENLWELARGFLYVPYLWGGRSDCGIDCSGLTQICAKMKNIAIPRDASQQANAGEAIHWDNRQTSDLVFFEKNDKVTHVGILAENDTIIHASGRVRIDNCSSSGIISQETRLLTHHFHSIRRI